MNSALLILLGTTLVLPICGWWVARWLIAPIGAGLVFYDGGCGFCHGWVRFLLRQDRQGHLHYAPLLGAAWREQALSITSDSVVVLTSDGRTLISWNAVRFLAAALGGPWRVAGWLLRIVPPTCGEWLYARLAAQRYRLAKQPTANCPILRAEARARFDLRP